MKFYYVYKALAHPEYNHYIQPFTIEERLMHVKEAERTLGSRIPWLCDSMSNELKTLLGGLPNPEFVIDPEGKVVRRRVWSDPDALRSDLAELLGAVEPVTRVSDLDLETLPPPKAAARGVVPRLEMPGLMRPLRVEPDLASSKVPFYAKLRAEAGPDLLDSGSGMLYIGFHLDPLYQVHWNNEVKPLEFELSLPDGVTASPSRAVAPKVEEEADADPREFLVKLEAGADARSFGLTVRYFACDDAQTFCVPVSQSYRIHLEHDRGAGRVMRDGGVGGAGGPGGHDPVQRMMGWDTDGDGRLTIDEMPERMRRRFPRMDANGDGVLDEDEIRAAASRMRRGGPPRRP